jgi:hypothetical protein
MGTNYYVRSQPPCEHCGREYDAIHIGKSSAGWCFGLRVYPEMGINSLEDWQAYWQGKHIEDEYGKEISHSDMLERITMRSRPDTGTPYPYKSWEQFFAENQAEWGPNNLLRHRMDGRFCIGHGSGPWDLMGTDFS